MSAKRQFSHDDDDDVDKTSMQKEEHLKWVCRDKNDTDDDEDTYGNDEQFKTDRKTSDENREYEIHYEKQHRYVCSVCKRFLPSNHYLHLHLQELHDSFFKVLSEKQNMFECMVKSCKRKFKNHKTRRLHLIDKHGFPKDYPFGVILGQAPREPSNHHLKKVFSKKSQKFPKQKPNRSLKSNETSVLSETRQLPLHQNNHMLEKQHEQKGVERKASIIDIDVMEDIVYGISQLTIPKKIGFGHKSSQSQQYHQKAWTKKELLSKNTNSRS